MDAEQIAHDVAERVRAILGEAEERAQRIVSEAEQEASRIRERAEQESRGRVEEVRRTLAELQQKLDGGSAANGAPAEAEVNPGPVIVPEPQPDPAPGPSPDPVPEPTPDPVPEPAPEPVPEPTPPPDEGTPPQVAASRGAAPPDAVAKSDDAAGARLVAMNMALDGASRETIEGCLAENYALDDAGALVDDVLALAAK